MFAAAGLADSEPHVHDRSDAAKRVRGGCPHRRGMRSTCRPWRSRACRKTDPSVTYLCGWVQDNPIVTLIPGSHGLDSGRFAQRWSAGAARLSTTPGAQATFTFTGTGISWIGARGTQSGIARVSLDGILVAVVDM